LNWTPRVASPASLEAFRDWPAGSDWGASGKNIWLACLRAPAKLPAMSRQTSARAWAARPSDHRRLSRWAVTAGLLSTSYVLLVFLLPAAVNLGWCTSKSRVCDLLPSSPLIEFDKWGDYLSGALVPLSLVWVAMAFRLQHRQLSDQAVQQAKAATIAYETQRIADRQALTALASTYIGRMETALRDLAELINSDLRVETTGSPFGRTPDDEIAASLSGVHSVFRNYHNILCNVDEVNAEDMHSLKSLFVDSDMEDYLRFFFEPYNEFRSRCAELDCMILMPTHLDSAARSLKWNFLRSTWKWHPDVNERDRLAKLVGWTDAELEKHFAEFPEQAKYEPYDVEEGRRRLNHSACPRRGRGGNAG
jgi:hypothetical protein